MQEVLVSGKDVIMRIIQRGIQIVIDVHARQAPLVAHKFGVELVIVCHRFRGPLMKFSAILIK